MNFVLFLLLNAVLLIRPEELYPAELEGFRLYFLVVIPCVLTSLPGLARQLSAEGLHVHPVSVCVLLFYAANVVGLFILGRQEEALFDWGPEFGKVILYYFLLLAIVDTRERFRTFVAVLILLFGILTLIAVAQFFGYTEFPNILPCVQRAKDKDGNEYEYNRLTSSGIFGDPNDLCLVLGLGILCCVYLLVTGRGVMRVLWLLPIPGFIYAVVLTDSRGGLLGLIAGLSGYLFSRFGGAKSLPLAAVVVLGGLSLVGSRGLGGGGTAHERVMLWVEGFRDLFNYQMFFLTGLGRGFYASDEGLVAHNSFVQAYVEMGFIGGGAFLGAFYFSVRMVHQLGRGIKAPGWAVEARHFAFGVLVGYGVACYSLTRNFVIPTYLALGLAGVLLDRAAWTLPARYRVDNRWFLRFAVLCFVGLTVLRVLTFVLVKSGI